MNLPFINWLPDPRKDENSNFNSMIVDACVVAEYRLCGRGYKLSCISSVNDRVSCAEKNVQQSLNGFLEGTLSFAGLTDPNHNVKNGRYQMVIGGN